MKVISWEEAVVLVDWGEQKVINEFDEIIDMEYLIDYPYQSYWVLEEDDDESKYGTSFNSYGCR